MGLLGYGTDNLAKKYSLVLKQSRGKLPNRRSLWYRPPFDFF